MQKCGQRILDVIYVRELLLFVFSMVGQQLETLLCQAVNIHTQRVSFSPKAYSLKPYRSWTTFVIIQSNSRKNACVIINESRVYFIWRIAVLQLSFLCALSGAIHCHNLCKQKVMLAQGKRWNMMMGCRLISKALRHVISTIVYAAPHGFNPDMQCYAYSLRSVFYLSLRTTLFIQVCIFMLQLLH